MKKRCGILCSITSLPDDYGIGTFSKKYLYKLIDLMKLMCMTYLQILPLNPTGAGNSPYQGVSAFAINPYLIDLSQLVEEGLLNKQKDLNVNFGSNPSKVDYGAMFYNRIKVLEKAFYRFCKLKMQTNKEYEEFCRENKFWLNDYAMFMALKESHKWYSWQDWEDEIKLKDPETMREKELVLNERILFYKFVQFKAFEQWFKFKKYANSQGIKVIGDIPMFCAEDSVDLWSNPQVFKLNKDLSLKVVAGCPPDHSSPDGQKWGNPVYDWDYLKNTKFDWWIKRFRLAHKLYDVIRIDHFIGLNQCYEVPALDINARNGKGVYVPGRELFAEVSKKIGKVDFIVEDLGLWTESFKNFMKDLNFPGMRILEFGLDSQNPGNMHMPDTYYDNMVAYPDVHDNNTMAGYLNSVFDNCMDNYKKTNNQGAWNWLHFIENFFSTTYNPQEMDKLVYAIIRRLYVSNAGIVIIPIQDLLVLDGSARMNIPGTADGNWEFRVTPQEFELLKNKYVSKMQKIAVETKRVG